MASTKIPKDKAGYLHLPDTQYECRDCPQWTEAQICVYMPRATDPVLQIDTCSYFSKGQRGLMGFVPLGILTREQLGWIRNSAGVGYSCKRCEYWNQTEWDCEKVDRHSPGDDPDMIHPDACCNFWGADNVRGAMETEDFYNFPSTLTA